MHGEGGVERSHILPFAVDGCLLLEVYTHDGIGTMVVDEKLESVREATMALAFGYAGLVANEGVNISLLFGAVSFVVGVFGGLVWVLSPEKAAKGTEAIAVPGSQA
jgi:hypothetical protein